jgi:hypothetical protein
MKKPGGSQERRAFLICLRRLPRDQLVLLLRRRAGAFSAGT